MNTSCDKILQIVLYKIPEINSIEYLFKTLFD